nr:IPT/TIG domain-containing protein [Allomuricauda sp.]
MKTIKRVSVLLTLAMIVVNCSKDSAIEPIPTETGEETKIPSVSSISPSNGPKGTIVTLNGENFGTDLFTLNVYFNETKGEIQTISDTQVTVAVPPLSPSASGAGIVSVKKNNITVDGPEYIYLSTGAVSTFSGSTVGHADGTGEQVQYNKPVGLAMDNNGYLYVADAANHKIRRIASDGAVITMAGSTKGDEDGIISTAKFDTPRSIAVNNFGTIYIADFQNHKIKKITDVGVVVTVAGSTDGYQDGQGGDAQFSYPEDIALDAEGNIYVADGYNNRIRKIEPNGMVTTWAGGEEGYVDGPREMAQFYYPSGITFDQDGNMYVVDEGNHKIRKITPDGMVTTLAGSGIGNADGFGLEAEFQYPSRIAADKFGNVYVTDLFNFNVRKISAEGFVSTLAGGSQGDADGEGEEAQFNGHQGILVNERGELFVADSQNHRIRKITQE